MALILRCAERPSKDEGQPCLDTLQGRGRQPDYFKNRMFLRRA